MNTVLTFSHIFVTIGAYCLFIVYIYMENLDVLMAYQTIKT